MRIASASLLLGASTALAFNPPKTFLNSSIVRDMGYSTSAEGAALCIAGNVSVSVKFEAHHWTVDIPTTLEAVTQFNIMSSSYDPNQIIELSTGIESINKTYNIWVRYCAPNKPRHTKNPKSIQILTAGGCLDHRYWDFAPGYSYVDAAASEGMATLSYDRLGTGLSDHPDPLLEVQGSAGAEVLHELVALLRSGAFGHKFDKIIGVGHSFGSGIIDKAVSSHPSDLDAILHTGFAWRFGPRIGANTVLHLGPPRLTSHLQHLPDGYFAPTTEVGLHYSLFKYPEFDPDVLQAQFRQIGTLSMGEMLLPTNGTFTPDLDVLHSFTGPVMIVLGEFDHTICGHSCLEPQNYATDTLYHQFPSADPAQSEAWVVPGAGHNMQHHRNAREVNKRMAKWVRSLDFEV